jgi:hypothetical protein
MSLDNHIPEHFEGNPEGFSQVNPFEGPKGFFEGLSSSIMARFKGTEALQEIRELSPLLAGLDRQMPYSLPQGYFDTNLESLSSVNREPVLLFDLIERTTPYEVPPMYFHELPGEILQKVKRGGKVRGMNFRRVSHLAIAACLTAVIALGGFFYISGKDALGDSAAPVAQQLKNVSNSELDAFINAADVASNNSATAENSNTDVRKMLKDVSNQELEQFLNGIPTDDEDLFLIN